MRNHESIKTLNLLPQSNKFTWSGINGRSHQLRCRLVVIFGIIFLLSRLFQLLLPQSIRVLPIKVTEDSVEHLGIPIYRFSFNIFLDILTCY